MSISESNIKKLNLIKLTHFENSHGSTRKFILIYALLINILYQLLNNKLYFLNMEHFKKITSYNNYLFLFIF